MFKNDLRKKKIYLFERQRNREKESKRQRESDQIVLSSTGSHPKFQGWNKLEPGAQRTSSRCPTWVSGTQILGPASPAFPLAGSTVASSEPCYCRHSKTWALVNTFNRHSNVNILSDLRRLLSIRGEACCHQCGRIQWTLLITPLAIICWPPATLIPHKKFPTEGSAISWPALKAITSCTALYQYSGQH